MRPLFKLPHRGPSPRRISRGVELFWEGRRVRHVSENQQGGELMFRRRKRTLLIVPVALIASLSLAFGLSGSASAKSATKTLNVCFIADQSAFLQSLTIPA